MNRGRGNPREGKARNIFLEVAKEEFIKNGFRGTKIRVIGDRTGYHFNNFYSYWKNKEEIFDEITSCVKPMTLGAACEYPVEFAMVIEKELSEEGTLVKKLSDLPPEVLVSLI
jgi:hypothetical protein